MIDASILSRASIEQFIVDQVARRPARRQALLADPKGYVERLIGHQLPEDMCVGVIEETPNKVVIRLPHLVCDGDELSDADLEQVAGGKGASQDNLVCGAAASGAMVTKIEIHTN
jgi:hypothetical protein